MKKLLSLVLAALLIVAALTPALAESPVEITVLFEGCNVTDDTAVLEQTERLSGRENRRDCEARLGHLGQFQRPGQQCHQRRQ